MLNYFILSEHDEHGGIYNGSAVIRGVRLMANGPATFDLNTHRGNHIGKRTHYDVHCSEWHLLKYTVPVLRINIHIFMSFL